MPRPYQVSGERVGAAGGEVRVVDDAEGVGAGDLGGARGDQVPDAAALVVDGDQQVGTQGPQRVREPAAPVPRRARCG